MDLVSPRDPGPNPTNTESFGGVKSNMWIFYCVGVGTTLNFSHCSRTDCTKKLDEIFYTFKNLEFCIFCILIALTWPTVYIMPP